MSRALLMVAAFVLASCGSGAPTTDGYEQQYGGSAMVYNQIAGDTSCDNLQATFDRASGNHDTAEPNSAEAKWTTGYMVAADARMKEIGCY